MSAVFKKIDGYKVFLDDDDRLGRGSCGEVWKGQNVKTGLQVAVKRASVDVEEEFYTKYVKGEVDVLLSATHPNIIKMFHSKRSSKFLYIFMELCEEGDLEAYIRKHRELSRDTLLRFMQGATEAVNYLHQLKPPIVHRDIKPENLLIQIANSVPIIKLTDFGFARRITSEHSRVAATYCGTLPYMAPEVNPDKHDIVSYNLPVDIFSLGLVFYAMLSHEPGKKLKTLTVDGHHLGEWISSQMKACLPIQVPVTFMPEDTGTQSRIKALILQMICPNAKNRVTIQHVCRTIKTIIEPKNMEEAVQQNMKSLGIHDRHDGKQ